MREIIFTQPSQYENDVTSTPSTLKKLGKLDL